MDIKYHHPDHSIIWFIKDDKELYIELREILEDNDNKFDLVDSVQRYFKDLISKVI